MRGNFESNHMNIIKWYLMDLTTLALRLRSLAPGRLQSIVSTQTTTNVGGIRPWSDQTWNTITNRLTLGLFVQMKSHQRNPTPLNQGQTTFLLPSGC